MTENGRPETRAKSLLAAISIGLKAPLQDDLKAIHLCEDRKGRPAKLASDTDLAAAVRTHFPKSRRVSPSSIHRFWLKTTAQTPPL